MVAAAATAAHARAAATAAAIEVGDDGSPSIKPGDESVNGSDRVVLTRTIPIPPVPPKPGAETKPPPAPLKPDPWPPPHPPPRLPQAKPRDAMAIHLSYS